jgi:hypothetical protein
MEITTDYIASLRKKVYDDLEAKENERKKYIDDFFDHHIPNLDHIRDMLNEAVQENPYLHRYNLHILTIGIQGLRELHMCRNAAIDYMQRAYLERFNPLFKVYTPCASVRFRIVDKKYIEVHLVFNAPPART